MSPGRWVEPVLEALRGGKAVAEVVVVAQAGGDASCVGRRLLVWDSRMEGGLGGEELDGRALELAREANPGTHEVEVGEVVYSLYLERHRPPDELVIVGAGHIARPLCRIGAMLGMRVLVLDDRPEFATPERFPEAAVVRKVDFSAPLREAELGPRSYLVLVTRGHKYDFEALQESLRRPVEPAYIGMVGSRRRVRAAMEQLAREGVARERLLRIFAPIGLDIGAETPEEIAVAIAAELIRVRRRGTGASLRDQERVVDRWIGEPE